MNLTESMRNANFLAPCNHTPEEIIENPNKTALARTKLIRSGVAHVCGAPGQRREEMQKEKPMKTKTTSLLLMVCLGLSTGAVVTGITGCAGDRYSRSTGEQIDDESVRMRVNSALHDNADYKFSGVNVAVFKGTVQLSGFVDTADQKTKAVELAKQVAGVKDVADSITVKEQNGSSNAASADDKSLTDRVRSALSGNPDYKFAEVKVAAFNGTVQLSGFVDTADQKARAGDIAKQVSGVQDIENNITVKP
jgi:hyperosmotically inducible periplasmic protein